MPHLRYIILFTSTTKNATKWAELGLAGAESDLCHVAFVICEFEYKYTGFVT